jgi:hypothetical protein
VSALQLAQRRLTTTAAEALGSEAVSKHEALKLPVSAEEPLTFFDRAKADLSWAFVGLGILIGLRGTSRTAVH